MGTKRVPGLIPGRHRIKQLLTLPSEFLGIWERSITTCNTHQAQWTHWAQDTASVCPSGRLVPGATGSGWMGKSLRIVLDTAGMALAVRELTSSSTFGIICRPIICVEIHVS